MIDILIALIAHSIATSALRAIVSRLYPEAIEHGATAFEILGFRFCRVGLRVDWNLAVERLIEDVKPRCQRFVRCVGRIAVGAAIVGSLCAMSVANFIAQSLPTQQPYATAWNY